MLLNRYIMCRSQIDLNLNFIFNIQFQVEFSVSFKSLNIYD